MVSDSVDGVSGATEVSEKFKEVYETLYNSVSSDDIMKSIKEKLRNETNIGDITEVKKVTGNCVKEACARMNPGKIDVTVSFTSDISLHGPDSLFDLLANVFRLFLVHGDVTLDLLSCAFIPLFKGGLKNPGLSDSYRAIARSSQIMKLLDNGILLIWGDLLSSDSLQFEFK